MIVSHQHKFIFIKTRKTAGSSIEVALSRLCGPGDIVTPLSEDLGEEQLRIQEGGYGPTGHLKPVSAHRGFKEWRRLLLRGRRSSYGQHSTAKEIRSIVGDKIWDEYLKVTVERNPWERALSRYWWQKYRWEKKGRTEFPDLATYIQWLEQNKPHWLTNWGHYSIDDSLAVDTVLFYETLTKSLEMFANKIGVNPSHVVLPERRAKSGMRGDRKPYQEILSDQSRDLIDRVCAKEIKEFGYVF